MYQADAICGRALRNLLRRLMGYSGPEFANWVQTETGVTVEIVKRPRRRFRVKEGEERPQLPPKPAELKILTRRLVIERGFG
jgi:hypothetical protein